GLAKTSFNLQTLSRPYQYSLFDSTPDKVYSSDIYMHHQQNILYHNITNFAEDIDNKNRKVISLFSGAGGFDIGLEQAGFETVACVEIDPDCRETLRYNRKQWTLFEDNDGRIAGDIREIEPHELLALTRLEKGEVALVIGGAPCQPFSNIGKKQGTNDPKNGDLFLEFVKMVRGIHPQAFLFENVVGITQARHANVIQYMMDKLEGLGYGMSYTVLNAANYGVGQRRQRFFLLGIQGVSKPAFPLPTHFKGAKEWATFVEQLDYQPTYKPDPWVTVEDVFHALPDDYQTRSDYAVMNISDIVLERMRRIGPGENFKVLPPEMLPNCWKSGKHQGNDTFGRLRLDEPSVTIRTAAYNPAKGKYIHPTENRGLNTIEMAALQGFPLDWTFKTATRKKMTLKSAGLQIGNAVPSLIAKALGLAIKAQI
ncbi:MAG: DNA cytosine methyltransferase, partial [Chloroflexota bacterium]